MTTVNVGCANDPESTVPVTVPSSPGLLASVSTSKNTQALLPTSPVDANTMIHADVVNKMINDAVAVNQKRWHNLLTTQMKQMQQMEKEMLSEKMDFTKEKFPTGIISLDTKSNDMGLQKRDVKSYATRVFQESTIGMVTSIASSHSKARKCLKSFLLTLCVYGFLHQCITFLLHVFEYPMAIDFTVENPKEISVPAYTFCFNNGMMRSIFCDKCPDCCYEPSEEFCSRLPHNYCAGNKTKIPREDFYDLEEKARYIDILYEGRNMDFDITHTGIFEDNIEGPFLRLKDEIAMKGPIICYSLHSVVNTREPPLQMKTKYHLLGETPVDTLKFFVDETEMFRPGSPPGIFFSIHSPYEAVNPFVKGIFMKPGITYRVYVSMDKETVLKDPYPTKCMNYVELWKASNRTGPRIQSMCQHKCILEYSMSCFNCVAPVLLYPSKVRMCNYEEMLEDMKCTKDDVDTFKKCIAACGIDCNFINYKHVIRERHEDYPKGTNASNLDEINRTVTVEVFLKGDEMVTRSHKPKYMNVEVFSAIGGFIGCWLGISLMDITDFFGSIFIVCSYAWRKIGVKEK